MNRREEQGGEQEDNQNMMSMAMLIQLQKEFEMLKKNNEEELSMLRAENAHMKRKLQEDTVLNSSFEIVQPRIPANERVHNNESSKQGEDYLRPLELLPEYLIENIHYIML